MIRPHDIPAPQQRYMPKKHGDIARRILDAAWQRYQETQFPEAERQRVGEIVAAELERRNPAADMEVLARYGLTQPEGKPETRVDYVQGEPNEKGFRGHTRVDVPTGRLLPVTVSTYNPYTRHWDGVGVEIPRTVRVASRSNGLTANVRAARLPEPYTVTPDNLERHKREGTWAEVVANNERYYSDLERAGLPAETDAYFQRVLNLRKAYREQYQGFNGWLESFRGATYPTWAEIAGQFPFIAEYLAELRAGMAVAA